MAPESCSLSAGLCAPQWSGVGSPGSAQWPQNARGRAGVSCRAPPCGPRSVGLRCVGPSGWSLLSWLCHLSSFSIDLCLPCLLFFLNSVSAQHLVHVLFCINPSATAACSLPSLRGWLSEPGPLLAAPPSWGLAASVGRDVTALLQLLDGGSCSRLVPGGVPVPTTRGPVSDFRTAGYLAGRGLGASISSPLGLWSDRS